MTSSRFIELVWLMLLAYCANMAPPFVKYWRGWNRPISRTYLGDHKTVGGFALGIVAGIVTSTENDAVHEVSRAMQRE